MFLVHRCSYVHFSQCVEIRDMGTSYVEIPGMGVCKGGKMSICISLEFASKKHNFLLT